MYDDGSGTQVDRELLAMVSGRPISTIRARCTTTGYRDGRALYHLDDSLAVLNNIPKRVRKNASR